MFSRFIKDLYTHIFGNYVILYEINKILFQQNRVCVPYNKSSLPAYFTNEQIYISKLLDIYISLNCLTGTHGTIQTIQFLSEDEFISSMVALNGSLVHFINAYIYYSLIVERNSMPVITFSQFCDDPFKDIMQKFNSNDYSNYSEALMCRRFMTSFSHSLAIAREKINKSVKHPDVNSNDNFFRAFVNLIKAEDWDWKNIPRDELSAYGYTINLCNNNGMFCSVCNTKKNLPCDHILFIMKCAKKFPKLAKIDSLIDVFGSKSLRYGDTINVSLGNEESRTVDLVKGTCNCVHFTSNGPFLCPHIARCLEYKEYYGVKDGELKDYYIPENYFGCSKINDPKKLFTEGICSCGCLKDGKLCSHIVDDIKKSQNNNFNNLDKEDLINLIKTMQKYKLN